MRKKKWNARSVGLVLAGLVPALMPVQVSAQALAYVNSDSVTVEAFSQGYPHYLNQNSRLDSLPARLDFLQKLAEELVYAQYGRDLGLEQDADILLAGQQAWREVLLREVAHSQFMEEVAIPADEIEVEYHFRNTALLSRYLSAPDSLAAIDYLKRLKAGELFESLALQAADSALLLDCPGELGWKFSSQLDSTYARRAYRLTPGQLSSPMKIAEGYQIIQLLDKRFRPDHGHFERVKYQQRIAAELRPLKITATARETLERWSQSLPIKWHRRAIRKTLHSGILEDPQVTAAADPATTELAAEVLFTLSGEPYTLDWILSRLDLLLPEERDGVNSTKALQELVQQLLMWDQLIELAASLPQADSLMAAADSLQQATVRQAVKDSLRARLLEQVIPPEDALRLFYADHRKRYSTQELVNLEEIVVRDSALAAALRDSLLTGNLDLGTLARRHTEREWARITGGRLGWVPLRIYGPAAPALIVAAAGNPNRLIGPLKADDYYILARPGGYQPEQVPPFEVLRSRLHRAWIAANQQRLIRAGLQQLQATSYPVAIDTNLVARLQLDETGRVFFPAGPDSALTIPEPANPD